jgi:purine-binding chemotaxis protein CheW
LSGTPAHWEQLARAAAAPPSGDDLGRLRQLLTFRLDASHYAVPVERVREIVRVRAITPIPRVTVEVRGVISLRGEIIQVIDARRRLGLEPVEPTRESRIVIVHGQAATPAGILVDRVTEVLRVSEESIQPYAAADSSAVEALCACGTEFVSLIDLDRVLDIAHA